MEGLQDLAYRFTDAVVDNVFIEEIWRVRPNQGTGALLATCNDSLNVFPTSAGTPPRSHQRRLLSSRRWIDADCDVDPGKSTNRTVISFVGPPETGVRPRFA